MSKKEKTNPLINFRRQEIDLVKFNEQTDKEQKEQIQKLTFKPEISKKIFKIQNKKMKKKITCLINIENLP